MMTLNPNAVCLDFNNTDLKDFDGDSVMEWLLFIIDYNNLIQIWNYKFLFLYNNKKIQN